MINFSDYSLKAKIAFVVTGVFIGLLVSTQLKSSVPTTSYISDEIAVRQQLIKSYTDDEALLKSKIVALMHSRIQLNPVWKKIISIF